MLPSKRHEVRQKNEQPVTKNPSPEVMRMWKSKELLTKPVLAQWRSSWKGHLQTPGKAHFLLLFAESMCLSASQSPATPLASSERCLGLAVSEQKWLQMKNWALPCPQQTLPRNTHSMHTKKESWSTDRDYGSARHQRGKQNKTKKPLMRQVLQLPTNSPGNAQVTHVLRQLLLSWHHLLLTSL